MLGDRPGSGFVSAVKQKSLNLRRDREAARSVLPTVNANRPFPPTGRLWLKSRAPAQRLSPHQPRLAGDQHGPFLLLRLLQLRVIIEPGPAS